MTLEQHSGIRSSSQGVCPPVSSIGLLLKSKVQFMQAEGARPFDGLTCSLSRISVLSIKFVFVESSFERKRRFALFDKQQKSIG